MVSPPLPLGQSSAATNSAADPATGFKTQLHLEMQAFDRLPPYWREFLRERHAEGSAVQLTEKLRAKGIPL